jgi:hypothetical protein
MEAHFKVFFLKEKAPEIVRGCLNSVYIFTFIIAG